MRYAGPAEILRASQKDDEFIKRLQSDIKEIAQRLKGDEWWLRRHRQLDSGATYVYLLLTSAAGLQTLGEEYAGVVQTVGRARLPGTLRRLAMVTLHTYGPLLVERLVRRWEGPSPARPRLSVVLHLLYQLNVTAFYLGAAYYHLDKRATGIRYLLVRPWMGDALSRRTFLLLGIVSLIHLCITAALQLRGIAAPDHPAGTSSSHSTTTSASSGGGTSTSSGAGGDGGSGGGEGGSSGSSGESPPAPSASPPAPEDASSEPVPHRLRCPLCLSRRSVTTATPCGHLFCWSCVVDWLQTQPSCPVCREEVPPHRVVALRAYDS